MAEPWSPSASADGTVRLWSAEDRRLRHTLGREASWSAARALLFSADDGILYSGHDDGQVHAWDVEDGCHLGVRADLHGAVTAMARAGDGSRMLWGAQGGTLCIWDDQLHQVERTVQTRRDTLHALAFTSDGGFTVASGPSLYGWEMDATSPHRELVGHTQPVLSLAATPGGGLLLSAGADHVVRLWDMENGQCARVLHETTMQAVTDAVISSDGRHAVSAGAHGAECWDLARGVLEARLVLPLQGISRLALPDQGTGVVGGGPDGILVQWNLDWDEEPDGRSGSWAEPAESPGETLLVAAREARAASGWHACGSIRDVALAHVLGLNIRGLTSVHPAADGRRAVTTGRDGRVHVIDLVSGRTERTLRVFRALDWAATGTYRSHVVTVDAECDVRIHDLDSGDLVGESSCLGMQLPLAASGDLLTVVSGLDSMSWQLWDLVRGYPVRVTPGAREGLVGVSMRADGRKLLTWSQGGWVQYWDVPSARPVHTIRDDTGAVDGVVFAPHGRTVAWVNALGEIRLWSPEAGTLEPVGMVADDAISPARLAFSPDATKLLWAAGPRAGIIDLGPERRHHLLVGHPAPVVAAWFGLDGTLAVTASQDGLVKIWAVTCECGPLQAGGPTAQSLCEQFLRLHVDPGEGAAAAGSGDDLATWLRRDGEASWSRDDLVCLQARLGHAGCGTVDLDEVEMRVLEQQVGCRLTEAASRALLEVAANGSLEEVGEYLHHGADPAVRDERGASALHRACAQGHLEVARVLVEAGASVETEDLEGCTPLHAAARADSADLVVYLVEQGAQPCHRDRTWRTPLHLAAAEGNVAAVRALLAAGADPCARSRFVDDERPPLHDAVIGGSVEVIEALCQGGADVTSRDVDQRIPLHHAAARGLADLAEKLVALGSDVEAADWDGCVPLHLAAEMGHSATVEALTRCGAMVDVLDRQSRSPLRVALRGGWVETARLLVSRGARTDRLSDGERASLGAKGGLLAGLGGLFKARLPALPEMNQRAEGGVPLLQVALQQRDARRFRRLLSKGGNPNLRNAEGHTALYLAVKEGNPELVQLLISAGANVRYRYEKGRTLLHLCARKGDLTLTRFLLAAGAEINVTDDRHRTPLAEAAYRKRVEMLEFLLAQGADGSIAADDWGTPYEICLRAPSVYEHADRLRYADMAATLVNAGQGIESRRSQAAPVEALSSGALQALGWSGLRTD